MSFMSANICIIHYVMKGIFLFSAKYSPPIASPLQRRLPVERIGARQRNKLVSGRRCDFSRDQIIPLPLVEAVICSDSLFALS